MNAPIVTRLACALAAAIFAPLWYWNGGVIDREAVYFVPHYVSEGSLAGKIFDPAVADWGDYQARELSYTLDFIDLFSGRGTGGSSSARTPLEWITSRRRC